MFLASVPGRFQCSVGICRDEGSWIAISRNSSVLLGFRHKGFPIT